MKNIIKVLILTFAVFAGVNAQEEVKVTESVKTEKTTRFEKIKSWVKANPKKSIAMSIPVAWWALNYSILGYDFIINREGVRDLILRDLKDNKKSLVYELFLMVPNFYLLNILGEKYD